MCTTCLSACLAPTFLKLLPFANISQIAGIRKIILQYVNVFSFEKKLKWKIGELVRKASSHWLPLPRQKEQRISFFQLAGISRY